MGQVQVILSEDVHALGDAGEIVSVKPGFARNYLIPQGKAMIATAERVNEVGHKKRVISEKMAKDLTDLTAVKAKLDGIALEVTAQAGDSGKLFGSVTAANLAELLGEKGLKVIAEFKVKVIGAKATAAAAVVERADDGKVGLGAAADKPDPEPLDIRDDEY
jgi:large subunit ribosomal protein L9